MAAVTVTDIAMFWGGLGLCAGMLLANFLWRLKIRERADLGFRLEMGGKLYEIRESDKAAGSQ